MAESYCCVDRPRFVCWWTFGLLLPVRCWGPAAVNVCARGLVSGSVLSPFGSVPRSGIAGSGSNSVLPFWGNHQKVFHSSCTIFHSHQQIWGSNVSSPHQHFWFSLLLLIALSSGCEGLAHACICLMTNGVEQLYESILAICGPLRDVCWSPFPFFNWMSFLEM